MVRLRLATFNCENLFARFKFQRDINPQKAIRDGWLANETLFEINDADEKRITGEAIKETRADVIALQEVESMEALRRFRNEYLRGRRNYKYTLVIDGNDPRLIDLGILSKYPLEEISTHIDEWDDELHSPLFSRDCLECDVVLPDNKRFRLFINHFKSMLDKEDPCNGRRKTRRRRIKQAERVKEIVANRFPHPDIDFAILGDFNDYLESDGQGDTAIDDIVNWDRVVNVVDRLPPEEQWTHYFKGNRSCGIPETYRQLDYILLSRSLAQRNANARPKIIRQGLPKRAEQYRGPRFEGVGQNDPKASDHCPVVIELDV